MNEVVEQIFIVKKKWNFSRVPSLESKNIFWDLTKKAAIGRKIMLFKHQFECQKDVG